MKITLSLFLVCCSLSFSFGQYPFEKHSIPEKAYFPTRDKQDHPRYNANFEKYDVAFYKIDLEATNTSDFIKGSVHIGATVLNEVLDTLVLELIPDYTIDSILVNSVNTPFTRDFDDILILPDEPLPAASWFDVVFYYEGEPESMLSPTNGMGNDPGYDVTFTLSEPFYSRAWFPSKPILSDKADSVFVFITTEDHLKVGANGLLTATIPLADNKVRYEWKSFYPTAFYLISFSVGEYIEYNIYAKPEGLEDSILIQNYLYNEQNLEFYKEYIDQTDELIEAFSDMFGMYPFYKEKYGHCQAPIGGGMEHQTMSTMSQFSFELVAHELAHMWFGDYVTCGTWQDIWINEGFATYSHLLALEYLNGNFPTGDMIHYQGYIRDYAAQGSIFIPEEYFDINWTDEWAINELSWRIFDYYLSYVKGAVFIHMIRYELNDDELFFRIIRDYLAAHQFATAIGTDFKQQLESSSGMDFTDFFNQWYFGEGYPLYAISWFQAGDSLYIRSTQSTSASTPLFKGNMDYLLHFEEGDTLLRLFQGSAEEIHILNIKKQVQRIGIDPNIWLLKKINSNKHEVFLVPGFLQDQGSYALSCYPNPFSDAIRIRSGLKGEKDLQIFDAAGNMVLQKSLSADEFSLDLDQLESGIYFIRLSARGISEVQKIIKQ